MLTKLRIVGIIALAGILIGLVSWGSYWKIEASKKDVIITEITSERDDFKSAVEEASKVNEENEVTYANSIHALQVQLKHLELQAQKEKEHLIKVFEDYRNAETVKAETIPQGVLDENTSKKRITDRNSTIDSWNNRVW